MLITEFGNKQYRIRNDGKYDLRYTDGRILANQQEARKDAYTQSMRGEVRPVFGNPLGCYMLIVVLALMAFMAIRGVPHLGPIELNRPMVPAECYQELGPLPIECFTEQKGLRWDYKY